MITGAYRVLDVYLDTKIDFPECSFIARNSDSNEFYIDVESAQELEQWEEIAKLDQEIREAGEQCSTLFVYF